ncbi:hypothetical protein SB763_33805, partial [Burkholderia sp. SIMBA_042]
LTSSFLSYYRRKNEITRQCDICSLAYDKSHDHRGDGSFHVHRTSTMYVTALEESLERGKLHFIRWHRIYMTI